MAAPLRAPAPTGDWRTSFSRFARAHLQRRLGRLRRRPVEVAATLTLLGFVACAGADAPVVESAAQKKDSRLLLDTTTRLLQDLPAMRAFSFVVSGFHAEKDDPSKQTESIYSCHRQSEDLTQCVLFDGEGEDARLVGVEYVISQRAFAKLPPSEKALWHPHNYEVLSGQLTAPGAPALVENALLEGWVNSWGKTWRLWDTGAIGHHHDPLPLGEPRLAWSFNADGEVNPQLIADRDRRLGEDTGENKKERRAFLKLAKPQHGVDALAAWFPLRRPIDGVRGDDERVTRLVDAWGSATTTQQQQQRQQ